MRRHSRPWLKGVPIERLSYYRTKELVQNLENELEYLGVYIILYKVDKNSKRWSVHNELCETRGQATVKSNQLKGDGIAKRTLIRYVDTAED